MSKKIFTPIPVKVISDAEKAAMDHERALKLGKEFPPVKIISLHEKKKIEINNNKKDFEPVIVVNKVTEENTTVKKEINR